MVFIKKVFSVTKAQKVMCFSACNALSNLKGLFAVRSPTNQAQFLIFALSSPVCMMASYFLSKVASPPPPRSNASISLTLTPQSYFGIDHSEQWLASTFLPNDECSSRFCFFRLLGQQLKFLVAVSEPRYFSSWD